MPRGKESDEDYEPKAAATGRMQTRLSSLTHCVSSPLRRSSRIKQNKYSPGSESDSGMSSSQAARSTKARTATMDPNVSDVTRKLRTRKNSGSSEIIEISDGDVPQTPTKRTTRQSSGASSLVGTPTRVNTRAASKRFVRAGSESQSSPLTRITRKTRASSIDPESLYDRNKSRLSSPLKTRKQASVSPSSSQVVNKEQIELQDRIPYVRLDATIIEAEEIISSDSSLDKISNLSQKMNRKVKIIIHDKVKDCDFEKIETLIDSIESKSDEILKSSEKKDEEIDVVTVEDADNSVGKIQGNSEKNPPVDNGTIEEFSPFYSKCSSLDSTEKDKIVDEDSISDLDKSLTDKCESTKELDTSSEEQKNNKENEVQNIVGNVSVEKSAQPKVISIKSLASPFMNKSSSEKETQSMEKQLNLSKRRRSRESTEIAIVHSDPSKEDPNSSKKQMDISTKSSSTDKVIVLQDSIEVIDEVTNKDEASIENKTSACNDDVTEVIGELDKIDKNTVTDSKNSTEMGSNEVDKRSSIDSAKSIQKSRKGSLAFGPTEDNNEMELEGQSPSQDEKLSSNEKHYKCARLENLEISTNIESSDDSASVTDKQSASTLDKTIDISDSIKQNQENLSKHVTESTSKSSTAIQEISSSTHDDFNDAVIQNNQSSDVEAPEKSTMDVSSEKTDANDILSEKTAEQISKRKSTDNLEKEKEISQMETCQEDQENVEIADDASDAGIDLFQDIPADEWKEKDYVETVSMQSTSQPVEEENECDFVLVDRRAWLAAENIKAAKEAEPFEYDSDDTVLLKRRLDASQSIIEKVIRRISGNEIEKSDTVKEDTPDTDTKENEKLKKRKSRTQRRLPEVSEIDENSSRCTEDEDEDEDAIAVEKSLNKSKTVLNQSNDRSISKLNKSKQLIKTSGQFLRNESDEKMEDVIELKNSSANESLVDNSEEELNNSSARTRKKLCENEHLNKSNNKDEDNATESKKKNVLIKNTSLNKSVDQKSKPASAKKTKHLNDNESDNSDVGEDESEKAATHRKSKTYSAIANMGLTESDENSDQDERCIPSFLFAKANSDTDNSKNSDINKEYNLDGVKQKFSDDDIAADECRNSEEEVSDPDDNGSDLADFIVYDDEIEDEEEEENNYEEEDDEEDDEGEEEDDEDMQNMEDENEDVQEEDSTDEEEDASKNKFVKGKTISLYASTPHQLPKIHKSKNKSVEYISSRRSETETTRDIDMKKSNVKKDSKSLTRSLLLDSSNSNLSIKKKKKSLVKGDKTVLSDTSNLMSSSLKKERKLDPQYSLRDETERDTSDRLNEFKSMSTKKSRVSMEFSTPNLNTCKKLNFDMSESNRDIKSNNTNNVTQNTSIKKNKLKKKSISKSLVDDEFLPALRDFVSNIDSGPMFSKVDSRKTMNIYIETPTIKFLRKEKLNESAPTLKWSTETSSLQKISMEEDTRQTKTKEKNDADEVYDDVVQKRSQTKQKKRKKSANENVTDKNLSENVIELNVPKKKKAKLTELTVVKDSTCEDACQISEKKKKQDKSKKNITDEAAFFEDATELNVPKKKKPIKLTSLTRKLVGDSNHEDACQTIEKQKKKKKREELTKENCANEASFEDRIQLKIRKGKKCTDLNQLAVVQDIRKDACQISEKKKKKKQDTSRENVTDKALSKNAIETKKHAKLTQLPFVDDNTSQDMYQVSERKKKKKKQSTSMENMVDKVLRENEIKLKVPKKKKCTTLTHLPNVKDNTDEDVQPIENRKRRKRDETTKKYWMDNNPLLKKGVQLKVNKKKRADFDLMEFETVLSKIPAEEPCQIKEEKKRKRKEATKENWMRDEALFGEEGVQLKVYKGKKRGELYLMQLESGLSKIPDEEPCQIEKEKRKRKETTKGNWMDNKALFGEEGVQLKIYKGKKRDELYLMQLESVLSKIPDEEPCQIEKEKRKRKETTKGNWMDNNEALFGEEGVQSKVYKKKKRDSLDQLAIVQDNVREDACQVEKEKKKKKKRINIAEEITNINEDNMLRKKIRRNEMEVPQHKKKNKTPDKQEKRVKRKIKQGSTEALLTERKDTSPVQSPVSNLLKYFPRPKSLQKTASSESKDAACSTENVKKTIRTAKVCSFNELKPKKKRDRTEDNENAVHVNVPARKSRVKEASKPSSGLKRLSDEMIEIIASTRSKKKRKVLQNEEKVVASVTTSKSKAATSARDDLSTFNVPGCATQFHVVNLQDIKKRSSKGAVAAASFRQRMLDRNNREPVSTYLMYNEKMGHTKQRTTQ